MSARTITVFIAVIVLLIIAAPPIGQVFVAVGTLSEGIGHFLEGLNLHLGNR